MLTSYCKLASGAQEYQRKCSITCIFPVILIVNELRLHRQFSEKMTFELNYSMKLIKSSKINLQETILIIIDTSISGCISEFFRQIRDPIKGMLFKFFPYLLTKALKSRSMDIILKDGEDLIAILYLFKLRIFANISFLKNTRLISSYIAMIKCWSRFKTYMY